MKDLIKEGKIRYWGISEANEEYLRRAHKICPVTAVENRYSMIARWHEALFPVLEELSIAFVAFSPMANGLLTGAYHRATKFTEKGDYRSDMPQFTEKGMQQSEELRAMLEKAGSGKHATPAQISGLDDQQEAIYRANPGSRKVSRLKENLGAGHIRLDH